jgi:hypothetical protein
LENLKGRDHLEDLGADGRITFDWNLGKEGVKMWIGFIWLRMEISGGLL